MELEEESSLKTVDSQKSSTAAGAHLVPKIKHQC